ncbi:response regulator [Pseudodesulfovibrio sp.]|uniref:response regulator n=1 Tax=unclassified Pseudodesulfovibrio TaxID=2661612 RepID=UPI003B008414
MPIDKMHARILVVDDSKSVRFALESQLREEGFEVTVASDGEEGLSKALDNEYDLIITDLDMPRMDGFELCTRLKAEYKTSHIPIIILSARDNDGHVERGFRVGADAYLAKGDKIEDKIDRIKDILRTKNFLTGSKILVADDSLSVRLFLQAGLNREGFITEIVSNGREALEKLDKFKPDIILTDLMMPELDGAELLRTIVNSPEHMNIPVVIMSTVSDRPLMRRLIREGAASFMIKPFTMNQMVIIIEELFSTRFRLLMEERERLLLEHRLTLAAIASLVQALEARDSMTRGHSERVGRIAQGIGGELDFSQKQLDRLLLAGQLHDLGKIGVRDAVLLKEGPLNHDEFEHVKSHSNMVAEILRPIESLQDILEVTLYHHERWDGTGYPEGLKGEDIPFLARIISVADVYEAVTSERPHRDSLPRAVALSIIKEERGKQLCPTCVDAFLRWYERTNGIYDLPEQFRQEVK